MTGLQFDGRFAGAVDADIHCTIPDVQKLYPYLTDYWRSFMRDCGHPSLEPDYYPAKAAIAARPGSTPKAGCAGTDRAHLVTQTLDETGASRAILNCLYGVDAVKNDHWGAAMAAAVNDWLIAEWLVHDPRLSASIVVAPQNVELAVAEIEKRAGDPRFVQVLMLVRSAQPLGRPFYWPIYEASARHGLPVAVHAGGGGTWPTTPAGWAFYFAEDYLSMSQAFQTQMISLVTEGTFQHVPDLKIVFAESGFTWLPPLMWRIDKEWKGLRTEVPWLDRAPSAIVRDHFRFTLQPTDEGPDASQLVEVIEHIGSDDMLMFSTDYPHWQYDDEGPMPFDLPPELTRKILRENAERTYRFHG